QRYHHLAVARVVYQRHCSLALHRVLPHLHSFPTRRSSDLAFLLGFPISSLLSVDTFFSNRCASSITNMCFKPFEESTACFTCLRSEEHTSELQSRFDLVFRLLLEKKKIPILQICHIHK